MILLDSQMTAAAGDWRSWELCPTGSFAIGFNLKIDNSPADKTGINTIKLICDNATEIVSYDGPKGVWGNNVFCPNNSRFVGFDYKYDSYNGRNIPIDDTSGNSVYFYCEDSTELRPTLEGVDGAWIGRKNCPTDYAICGLIVQYQDDQGTLLNEDDTALNNVKFKCCSLI